MKIHTQIFAVIIAFSLAASPVYAQGSGAGVTPDSFLYGLDVALDDIRYLLTLDPQGKAKVGLEIAEERLAEVREMILQNKLDAVQRAEHEHGKALGRVRNVVDSLPGDETGEEEADEIEREIRIHEQDITEIRGNLEIQIKSKGQITAEQQVVIDSVLNSLENQTGSVKVKINEKKNEIKIKIKTGKGKPEILREEIEAEEEDEDELEEIEHLTAAEKEEKAEEQIEDAEDELEECKASLDANATGSATVLIANAEKHLASAKEALDKGKSGRAFGQANAAFHNAINACKPRGNETAPPPLSNVTLNGTVSGMKFEDVNGNGVKDANDTALANWTIFIDANNNGTLDAGEASTLTGTNGLYSFTNLTPGNYTVREVVQSGWVATTPNPVAATVTSNTTTTVNFGNFQLGSISGVKFNDANNNTIMDGNETGLADWSIALTGTSGNTTTLTDANGTYSFTGLGPGTYAVSEVLQANWTQTAPSNGTYTVVMTSGLAVTGKDFGNLQLE